LSRLLCINIVSISSNEKDKIFINRRPHTKASVFLGNEINRHFISLRDTVGTDANVKRVHFKNKLKKLNEIDLDEAKFAPKTVSISIRNALTLSHRKKDILESSGHTSSPFHLAQSPHTLLPARKLANKKSQKMIWIKKIDDSNGQGFKKIC
jgi:hypothetical protein